MILLASPVIHIIMGMLSRIKQAIFNPTFCRSDLFVTGIPVNWFLLGICPSTLATSISRRLKS
nr:MAG TPA: hypothetical protein [Caudoviricetes sp.]